MFVIKCSDNGRWTGAYVNRPGMQHSYTFSLENAQKFTTRESAQGHACENESVLAVSDIILGR